MGRHSAPRSTPKVALVAAPLVAIAGIVGGVALVNHHDDAPASSTRSAGTLPGCSSVTPLRVTTTDDLEPTLRTITERLERNGKDCIDYTVTPESSSVTASGLMSGANDTTQVWIPDSSLWASRVTQATPSVKLDMGPVIATSPVVFALPHTAKNAHPGTMSWSQLVSQKVLPTKVATPERSTTSLLTLLGVKSATSSSPGDTKTLQALLLTLASSTVDERQLRREVVSATAPAITFPASEQQIWSLNRANPTAKVRAMTPSSDLPQLDYRVVTVGRGTPPDAKAVQALRAGLADAESIAALRQAGFRVGDTPGPGVEGIPAAMPKITATPSPADADTALRAWVTMGKGTRMLTVIDTSESMKKPALPGLDRMGLARQAAVQALQKFPPSSQIGLWSFDLAHGHQAGDWMQRVPIRQLDEKVGAGDQRAALGQAASALTWQKADGTALYDTIWAGYQEMQRTYQPDYTNTLLLITDGKNEDPSSISEAQLIANLKKASADTSRPVRLVLVGVSGDADIATLQRIAKAVPDGKPYDARRVENFFAIMQQALISRSISPPQ